MRKQYKFSEAFNIEQVLSKQKCVDLIKKVDADDRLSTKVGKIAYDLRQRFSSSTTAPPKIDGKSLNPFVLSMISFKNKFSKPTDLVPILQSSKEFSSFETSAGKIIEDIFPFHYGFTTEATASHDPFSEIDCIKKDSQSIKLIALKSGPSCMNDTMANKIGSAIAEYNHIWFERYKKTI